MNEYAVTVRWDFFNVTGRLSIEAPDEVAAWIKADRMCTRRHEILSVELIKENVNHEAKNND